MPRITSIWSTGAYDEVAVRRIGATHAVNVSDYAGAVLDISSGVELKYLDTGEPILDRPTTKIVEVLAGKVTRFIQDALRKGGVVVVNCNAGVSRSASLVLAFMMEAGHLSLHQAWAHLNRCRPVVQPNIGFWHQLVGLEMELQRRKKSETTTSIFETTAASKSNESGTTVKIPPAPPQPPAAVASTMDVFSYIRKELKSVWPKGKAWQQAKAAKQFAKMPVELMATGTVFDAFTGYMVQTSFKSRNGGWLIGLVHAKKSAKKKSLKKMKSANKQVHGPNMTTVPRHVEAATDTKVNS